MYSLLQKLNSAHNVAILLYHGFTDKTHYEGIENYHGKHLFIEKFKAQLSYLQENFHVISLEKFIDGCIQKQYPPSRSIVLTFDDGYRSNYLLAYPLLKEFAMPATIFITTDFVDKKDFLWMDRLEYALNHTSQSEVAVTLHGNKKRYGLCNQHDKKIINQEIKSQLKRMSTEKRETVVTQLEQSLECKLTFHTDVNPMYAPLEWTDIREMLNSALITIGNHTSSHTILTSLTEEEMRRELIMSQRVIEEKTAHPCRFFAYPNGGREDFNKECQQVLTEIQFHCALTTIVGVNNIHSDVMALKRLNVHNDGELAGFIRSLSGMGRTLRGIKNAVFSSGKNPGY
jgi:peptidoglycan/xylan/chitin deacetylase (PgdA/CDA1 family)